MIIHIYMCVCVCVCLCVFLTWHYNFPTKPVWCVKTLAAHPKIAGECWWIDDSCSKFDNFIQGGAPQVFKLVYNPIN